MALIHYFGTHGPYQPSRESRRLLAPDLPTGTPQAGGIDDLGIYVDEEGTPPSMRDLPLYDACIRDVDGEIARMAAFLEERGLADNTVLIVTADHGEAFQEHGRFSHGWSLYDEEIRIPLVVHFPRRYPQAERLAAQARSIDVFPTILDLAGIEPPMGIEGRSLITPRAVPGEAASSGESRQGGSARKTFFPPEVAFSETSMRSGVPAQMALRTLERKVVVEPPTEVISVYDLKEDPAETDDLWPDRVDSGHPLLNMLSAVPGFSVGGWRLAFTGSDNRDVIDATVNLPAGARIVQANKVASRGRFDVNLSADRRSMQVIGAARDLDLLIFYVEPEDAELEITVKAGGAAARGMYVGRESRQPLAVPFRTAYGAASGMPVDFEQCRMEGIPAIFIWWAPGHKMQAPAPAASLAPEEEKRLKSLGYIH
jgi:hypothetical protein